MLKSLSLTSVVLAFGVLASPAVAAPASSLQSLEAANSSLTEQVGYRRCYWHRGHRHCRWVDDGYLYGPSINLNLGGGHRCHRHRRHHRHY